MDFRPQVGEKITIDQPFVFTPHPAAPSFPYGQSGRRGTVYQIRSELDQSIHAVKVFTESFRDSRNATNLTRLIQYSSIPGLQACNRRVITPDRYPNLLQRYPQLVYSVLMPWVEGETWFDIVFGQQDLTTSKCLSIAQSFLYCLTIMEKNQLAHCDLSGANLMIQMDQNKVALVDVEEMYAPDLEVLDPKKRPAGTPGYAHKVASRGLWSQEADRFAGSILLAEILGWCSPAVRENACEAQYFEENEVQDPYSKRYQVLRDVLRKQWSNQVSDLFARAWYSKGLAECPSFENWAAVLQSVANQMVFSEPAAAAEKTNSKIEVSSTVQAAPDDGPAAPSAPVLEIEAPVYKRVDTEAAAPIEYHPQSKPIRSRPVQSRPNLKTVSPLGRRRTLVIVLAIIGLLGAVGGGIWLFIPRGTSGLTGMIVDLEDGKPVSAKVVFSSSALPWALTAETDSAGRFTFNDLPALQGKLQVEAIGFSQYSKEDIVLKEAEMSEVPISLQLTGLKVFGYMTNAKTNERVSGMDIIVEATEPNSKNPVVFKGKTIENGDFKIVFMASDLASLNFRVTKSGYQEKSFEISASQQDLSEVSVIPSN